MAFKEVTKGDNAAHGGGFFLDWSALDRDECPRCLGDIIFFQNIGMWKCACGFKIGTVRLSEIAAAHGDKGTFNSRGYRIGNYDDEPPF